MLWSRGEEEERKWDNRKSSKINCGDGGIKPIEMSIFDGCIVCFMNGTLMKLLNKMIQLRTKS